MAYTWPDLPSAYDNKDFEHDFRSIWATYQANLLEMGIRIEGHYVDYVWDDEADRIAQTGMSEGQYGLQLNTGAVYKYISFVWTLQYYQMPSNPFITSDNSTTDITIDNSAVNGDPQLQFSLSGVDKFTLGIDDSDGDKFKIGTTAVAEGTMLTLDSEGNLDILKDITLGGTIDGYDLASYLSLVTLDELTQVGNIDTLEISNTEWGYLAELDQSLITSADVTFNSINGYAVEDYLSLVSTDELTQVGNINTLEISNTEWGYLAELDQSLTTTSNVEFGNITGTLVTASQTNITQVGTLASLSVTGNITVGGNVDGVDVAALKSTVDGLGTESNVTFASLVVDTLDLSDNSTKVVNSAWVTAKIADLDISRIVDEIDCSSSPSLPAADAGDIWVVSVAGLIGGGSGETVEAGDTLLCITDESEEGDWSTVGDNWVIGQSNLDPNLYALLTGATFAGTVEINTTTGAFILPRMQTTEKNALSPAQGWLVFDTDLQYAQVYRNGSFFNLGSNDGIENITTYVATDTIASSDDIALGNHATVDITLTLPTAVGCIGKVLYIKNINDAEVTVEGDGSETIDGALNYLLDTKYECITVVSDGSNWWII